MEGLKLIYNTKISYGLCDFRNWYLKLKIIYNKYRTNREGMNMKLYLTSSIGESYIEQGKRIPCSLDESNGFVTSLRNSLPQKAKCLIISSSPDNEEINDSFRDIFEEAFVLSDLTVVQTDICDLRNESITKDIIYGYDLLILAGGHVPTQNQFFHRIHLSELIQTFQGIVVGISAGTMNSARIVYAQPEVESEVSDPGYQKYIDGLGLTDISVLPHFQELKGMTLAGYRILEDISLPDSRIRPFYALVDGSYILIEDEISTLFGEAYLIENGEVRQVCEKDKCLRL